MKSPELQDEPKGAVCGDVDREPAVAGEVAARGEAEEECCAGVEDDLDALDGEAGRAGAAARDQAPDSAEGQSDGEGEGEAVAGRVTDAEARFDPLDGDPAAEDSAEDGPSAEREIVAARADRWGCAPTEQVRGELQPVGAEDRTAERGERQGQALAWVESRVVALPARGSGGEHDSGRDAQQVTDQSASARARNGSRTVASSSSR